MTETESRLDRFVAGVRAISGALWSRQQRKHLFDLAEGRPWDNDEGDRALREAVAWLVRELSLGPCAPAPMPDRDVLLAAARALAMKQPRDTKRHPSASRELVAIAPMVSVVPETLANQLVTARSKSRAVRWMLLLGRCASAELPLDAWLYHRRTPSSVAQQILSWAGRSCFDAGDELLALSLLALWQRRRPTERVLANRGARKPRSATPKRIVPLLHAWIDSGQRKSLVDLATKLEVHQKQSLLLFVIEASLSAAHVRSMLHRKDDRRQDVEPELRWVEATVAANADLLCDDAEALRFRVATQRAFGRGQIVQWSEAVSSEYVRASWCVARHRERVDGPCADTFGRHEPGVCMLLPQLNERARVRP